ncbi:MAG: hypothetical protein JWR83_3531 [Aeromicrobium sp.]|nr:hypothetical protein [Aeromicrobium sp.]
MTSLADRTIADLRTLHDELEAIVPGLTNVQLTGPSGASEWTVAQVLSHLGSGAEIGLETYRVTLDGAAEPADDFNQSVWARWDSSTPQQQASGVLEHDTALVERIEALTPEQRESTQIKLGFLPAPLPVASIAGMRLNEVAQHGWDVRVGLDPTATIDHETAELLHEHFSGGLGFLLGFIAKSDVIEEPTVVALGDSDYRIVINPDGVSLTADGATPTATFNGPAESAARRLTGRLKAEYTPAEVTVTGNITLDQLRQVFPGF